jgi:hypothetical protein
MIQLQLLSAFFCDSKDKRTGRGKGPNANCGAPGFAKSSRQSAQFQTNKPAVQAPERVAPYWAIRGSRSQSPKCCAIEKRQSVFTIECTEHAFGQDELFLYSGVIEVTVF